MSVGRISVLIMGFSFEDALLVDFLVIVWWCSGWEGRNLVVVARMGGQLSFRGSQCILFGSPASNFEVTSCCASERLQHIGIFSVRIHRYLQAASLWTSSSYRSKNIPEELFLAVSVFLFDSVTTWRSVKIGCHFISHSIDACRLHHVQVGQTKISRFFSLDWARAENNNKSYNRVTACHNKMELHI